jgi:hypothetical protein
MPAATAVKSLEFEAIWQGQLFFVVAIAVALGEDEFVVDHDADANTRRVPVSQYLLHVSIEACELFGDVGLLGANRECGEHQHECQCEQPARASRSKETRMAVEIHEADSFRIFHAVLRS